MHKWLDLSMLVAGATLFAWLGMCSRKSARLSHRMTGAALSGFATAALSAVALLVIIGLIRTRTRYAPVSDFKVGITLERVQRGQEIADSFCSGCHSITAALTGGRDLGQDLSLNVGSFVASNLTPAGPLRRWTDGQIFRAIRNAVDADGRWLVMMSYTNASHLSDSDIEAVIAYLRSRRAQGASTADLPDDFNLRGLVLLGAHMLPTGAPVVRGAIVAPPKGPNASYGAYILSYQDCRACHGPALTGGVPGQLGPIAPDLELVKAWSPEQFAATMRTGVDPGGHHISSLMPWQAIGRMDDVELRAVYEYLNRLPERNEPLQASAHPASLPARPAFDLSAAPFTRRPVPGRDGRTPAREAGGSAPAGSGR